VTFQLTAFLSHEEHALDDSETGKKEKNQQHVCPEYHHWGLSLARVSFLLASFVTCLLLQIEYQSGSNETSPE
jgi:hypothetical protein